MKSKLILMQLVVILTMPLFSNCTKKNKPITDDGDYTFKGYLSVYRHSAFDSLGNANIDSFTTKCTAYIHKNGETVSLTFDTILQQNYSFQYLGPGKYTIQCCRPNIDAEITSGFDSLYMRDVLRYPTTPEAKEYNFKGKLSK